MLDEISHVRNEFPMRRLERHLPACLAISLHRKGKTPQKLPIPQGQELIPPIVSWDIGKSTHFSVDLSEFLRYLKGFLSYRCPVFCPS